MRRRSAVSNASSVPKGFAHFQVPPFPSLPLPRAASRRLRWNRSLLITTLAYGLRINRRDLQSRHRQLAATRSLSRPIITGTYSAKCSPPLKHTSGALRETPKSTTPAVSRAAGRAKGGPREARPLCHRPTLLRTTRQLPLPSIFARLVVALYLTVISTTDDNQGPRPLRGWTASLIRANYAERLKRFNCLTRLDHFLGGSFFRP